MIARRLQRLGESSLYDGPRPARKLAREQAPVDGARSFGPTIEFVTLTQPQLHGQRDMLPSIGDLKRLAQQPAFPARVARLARARGLRDEIAEHPPSLLFASGLQQPLPARG